MLMAVLGGDCEEWTMILGWLDGVLGVGNCVDGQIRVWTYHCAFGSSRTAFWLVFGKTLHQRSETLRPACTHCKYLCLLNTKLCTTHTIFQASKTTILPFCRLVDKLRWLIKKQNRRYTNDSTGVKFFKLENDADTNCTYKAIYFLHMSKVRYNSVSN